MYVRHVKPRASWCHDCALFYYGSDPCFCQGSRERDSKAQPLEMCVDCHEPKQKKHKCHQSKCDVCKETMFTNHRCTIFSDLPKVQNRFIGEVITYEDDVERVPGNRAYNLIAYDIESSLEITEMLCPSYHTTDGFFDTSYQFIMKEKCYQTPNLVVWKNVFTGEDGYFYSVEEFVRYMMEENDGMNICVAHNSKGYDGRLIFEAVCQMRGTSAPKPLMRGSQILQLKFQKTIFRDSLLHLPGSISSLAKDCLQESGIDLEKGEFPHFFNQAKYKGYVGPLPGDEFYDLKYSVKSAGGMESHRRFREKWEGRNDWDADKMLLEYCQNDVEILSALMKFHHENCKRINYDIDTRLAISPWFKCTSAGYVHEITRRALALDYDGDTANTWVTLRNSEYYFARKALRGGRTEVRKFYHKCAENEIIKCVDVHSMYPSIQIGKSITVDNQVYPLLFPVGTPVIEIHDSRFYPCTKKHYAHPTQGCNCTLQTKKHHAKGINVVEVQEVDIEEYLQNFDGIVMVDVTPPKNIYHPILPVFDEITKKCVFSCEPIVKKVFGSPQLKLAMDHGYRVTKIYRADRYRLAPSKWRKILGNMYMMKYYSSSNGDKVMGKETTEEMKERHIKYYKEHFDIDVDFSRCKKMPAIKQTAKILINSAWGKHAESADHQMSIILDENAEVENATFLHQVQNKEISVDDIFRVHDMTMIKYSESRSSSENLNPKLYDKYLPCAVFVPMYGQMMVWNILNIVGERALMCDTDSVKYISNGIDPDITPQDYLGTWEDEGNLTEFVSIGLKSYGLRYQKDKPDSFKLKGCSLKYTHKNLINFDTMKNMLMNNVIYNVPQLTFDYEFGRGISTREFLKKVKFDASILKGNYDPISYKLYPYGYERFPK